MQRTKLCERSLPDYTKGEELFNMISHIVGGSLGIAALVLCVVRSSIRGDAYDVVGCAVYGAALVLMYTVSSVYHGINCQMAKQVMRVIDHCMIYFLIGGTYTPILLSAIRRQEPVTAWVLFGVVWGFAALATGLTAIDLKKYSKFSFVCYIGMGWCIVFAAKSAIRSIDTGGLLLLFLGGVAYTIGAVIYGLGKKHRYMHSVFHLFVVMGSVLQYFSIFFYVI